MELQISQIGCRRDSRRVLKDVSFSLKSGEAMLLRGPNGAGKSTLLRVLAGLLPYDQGSISIDGVEIRSIDEMQERIAYTGHLDAIKQMLSVEENLKFWASLFGGGDHRPAMERFRLTELADRPAHICSAGQKRRLGLARLAVSNRPIWLLDEPTVSLDAEMTVIFADCLSEHCKGGGIALIATHIELGLSNPKELRIQPLQEHHAVSDDPFITGDWQ